MILEIAGGKCDETLGLAEAVISVMGCKWEGIERLKSNFAQVLYIWGQHGKHIPVSEYSEKAAECREEVQWAKATGLPEEITIQYLHFTVNQHKIKDVF